MNKEEIIDMAEQAGFMFTEHGSPIGFTHSMLEVFARLIAEKEREACAVTARLALQHIHKVGEIAEAAIRTRGKA